MKEILNDMFGAAIEWFKFGAKLLAAVLILIWIAEQINH